MVGSFVIGHAVRQSVSQQVSQRKEYMRTMTTFKNQGVKTDDGGLVLVQLSKHLFPGSDSAPCFLILPLVLTSLFMDGNNK